MLRRRTLAMTLAEVVVYCGLLCVFSMMLFTNLPQRDSIASEDLRTATSQASTALSRWAVELSNASASSISVTTAPPGMLFLSAQSDLASNISYTSNGEIAWKGWVGYFQQGNTLVRVWYPLPASAARSAVGSAPLPTVMLSSGQKKVLSQKVKSFSVSSPEANLWQSGLTIDVKGSSVTVNSGVGARN